MKRHPHHTPFQVPNKTSSRPNVSDVGQIGPASGIHQKLIRQPDGRFLLIVHEASGSVRRFPVLVFENGFAL